MTGRKCSIIAKCVAETFHKTATLHFASDFTDVVSAVSHKKTLPNADSSAISWIRLEKRYNTASLLLLRHLHVRI
jgi:hypothetical protein